MITTFEASIGRCNSVPSDLNYVNPSTYILRAFLSTLAIRVADLDFPSHLTIITRSPILTDIDLGYMYHLLICLSLSPLSIGAAISRCLRG